MNRSPWAFRRAGTAYVLAWIDSLFMKGSKALDAIRHQTVSDPRGGLSRHVGWVVFAFNSHRVISANILMLSLSQARPRVRQN